MKFMNYCLCDLVNFSEITDEDRKRSNKYAIRGAIGYGTLNSLANMLPNAPGTPRQKLMGSLLGFGAGYYGGKLVARLRRGSKTKKK
jgi:hypothetical protein